MKYDTPEKAIRKFVHYVYLDRLKISEINDSELFKSLEKFGLREVLHDEFFQANCLPYSEEFERKAEVLLLLSRILREDVSQTYEQ